MSYFDEYAREYASKVTDVELLCGEMASFDYESGMSYRCNRCNAVVGSIGMPKRCKELYDMEEVINKLKGTK